MFRIPEAFKKELIENARAQAIMTPALFRPLPHIDCNKKLVWNDQTKEERETTTVVVKYSVVAAIIAERNNGKGS